MEEDHLIMRSDKTPPNQSPPLPPPDHESANIAIDGEESSERRQPYSFNKKIPYLETFVRFTDLPTELRQIIWRLTLQPRTIEILFSNDHGFYTKVKTPVALKTCQDSRNSVSSLYHLCFGSVIHDPKITFNFALDTLFFNEAMHDLVYSFLCGMTDCEAKSIESIAIEKDIDDWPLWNERASTDSVIDILRRAIPRMPAIKQLLVVHVMDEMWHDHFDSGSFSGWPHGSGPTELYDEFQVEWQKIVHEIHIDDEDSMSQCIKPLKLEDSIKKIAVPKIEMVWGWRPTKLDDEMIRRIHRLNDNWHD